MKKASYLKFVLSSEILKTSYKRKQECQCHKCHVIFVNVNSKMCGKVTLWYSRLCMRVCAAVVRSYKAMPNCQWQHGTGWLKHVNKWWLIKFLISLWQVTNFIYSKELLWQQFTVISPFTIFDTAAGEACS